MIQPVACSLTPAAQQARRATLLTGLADTATTRERLLGGYRLTFDASSATIARIVRVVATQRQCCPWLRFDLVVPEHGGAITLTVSGPAGSMDVLAEMFRGFAA